MATAKEVDAYLQQVYSARTQLQACFRRAHEILTDREADLLRQLDDIQTSYKQETKSREEEIQDLEKSKRFLKTSLHDNDTLNKALVPLTDKLEQLLRLASAARSVRFQWNTAFEGDLQLAGAIITASTVPPAVITHANSIPYIFQPNLTHVIPQITISQHNLTPVIPQPSIPQPNLTPVFPQISIHQPNLTPVVPQTSIPQLNFTPVIPQTSISQPNLAPFIFNANLTPSILQTSIPQTNLAPFIFQPNLTPSILQASISQPNLTPSILQTSIPQLNLAPSIFQPNLTPVIPQPSIPQPNLTPVVPQTSVPQPNLTPVVSQISIHQPNLPPVAVVPQTSIPQPNFTPVILQTSIPQPNLVPSIFQPNLTPVIPQTSIPQPNLKAIPDYRNKSIPVICCCKQGTSPGQLRWPEGLAIEPQSGRIFIADSNNNRVQVYTPDGEYCYLFRSNMDCPRSICIYSNTVYVSQNGSHCITLYKLDGACINRIGSEGTSNGEFKYPRGIAVSATSEHLYVCDASNNRVQIFINSRKYHSQFGNNTLKHPRDIKLSNDTVIVLDIGNPCIHIFSITNCSLLNSIINKGTADAQIGNSYHFTMDAELNLIITDYMNHYIKMFSKTGNFITQIGRKGQAIGEFIYPSGIAIDRQHRIIVVSDNKNYSLQIF